MRQIDKRHTHKELIMIPAPVSVSVQLNRTLIPMKFLENLILTNSIGKKSSRCTCLKMKFKTSSNAPHHFSCPQDTLLFLQKNSKERINVNIFTRNFKKKSKFIQKKHSST